jgi:hypothetical protein
MAFDQTEIKGLIRQLESITKHFPIVGDFKVLFLFIVLGIPSCKYQEKFDKVGWPDEGRPSFPPPSRNFMLKDLQENYKLINRHESKVLN